MAWGDDIEGKTLRLSEAVLYVWGNHSELSGKVLEELRLMNEAEGMHRTDSLTVSCHVAIALDEASRALEDPEYFEARMTMMTALLRTWRRLRPDLQARVLKTVENLALSRGQDHEQARMDALEVLSGATEGHRSMSERIKANEKKTQQRRAQKDRLDLKRRQAHAKRVFSLR